MKYNVISHITTACNFDCSYCDVIKDKKFLSSAQKQATINFIVNNHQHIQRFKFFGWEPLLASRDIQDVVSSTYEYIGKNFEIVTNTTLLTDDICHMLTEHFSHIFFSIDSENTFNYDKVLSFIEKYALEKRLYFNLIISPGSEELALSQFQRLYTLWMRGFNILPVYFTQPWSKENLQSLSMVMKRILDTSLTDASLRLYGFQENKWYDTSLANNTLFIDIDRNIYFSDMVSTFSGQSIKKHLHLGNTENIVLGNMQDKSFESQKKYIYSLEQALCHKTPWQKELHKIMDYFSHYLNAHN